MTMDDVLTAFGAEAGDLAGVVQKEFSLEAEALPGIATTSAGPEIGQARRR